MRWFKHDADARNNPKLKAAEKLLCEAGYARFFKLIEIVATRGGKAVSFEPLINLREPHTKLDWLAEEMRITPDDARKTLKVFAKLRLIDVKAWRSDRIFIPQMNECLDEWTTRKLRKSSGATPESLGSDSGKSVEKELEKEPDKEPDRKAEREADPASTNCRQFLRIVSRFADRAGWNFEAKSYREWFTQEIEKGRSTNVDLGLLLLKWESYLETESASKRSGKLNKFPRIPKLSFLNFLERERHRERKLHERYWSNESERLLQHHPRVQI